MSTYVVRFRTLPNGSYKNIKRGQRRGYWRLLEVKDPKGSTRVQSSNIVRVIAESPQGIYGVTRRSSYWIGGHYDHFRERATTYNMTQVADV
jgi:hypothetical protein